MVLLNRQVQPCISEKTAMKREAKTDMANEMLWTQRFNDPGPLLKKITRIFADAEKTDYAKGIAYLKM